MDHDTKLILYMLAKIGAKVAPEDGLFAQVEDAISSGNSWQLPEISGLRPEADNDGGQVEATRRIIAMWHDLEESFEHLEPELQERVNRATAVVGARFPGFYRGDDIGQNRLRIAHRIVTPEVFSRFVGRNLECHFVDNSRALALALDTYDQTLDADRNSDGWRHFTDIVQILKVYKNAI